MIAPYPAIKKAALNQAAFFVYLQSELS